MDDIAIRCAECKWEVDEFTAIAEGWRYYSYGRDLLAYCPACARRELAHDAPASGLCPRSSHSERAQEVERALASALSKKR